MKEGGLMSGVVSYILGTGFYMSKVRVKVSIWYLMVQNEISKGCPKKKRAFFSKILSLS